MAPTEMLVVDELVFSITLSFLLQNLPHNLTYTKIFRIRAPLSNERIVLFDPSLRGLIDAYQGRNLVFFLKQHEFGLTFPFRFSNVSE